MRGRPSWGFGKFAGDILADRLPYRKRGFLRGPQVCEYAALVPMAKALFFFTAALGLANRDAAEVALANITGFGNWPRFVLPGVSHLDTAVELLRRAADTCFEDIYPTIDLIHAGVLNRDALPSSVLPLPRDYLLTPDQCALLLQFWVQPGLEFGYLLPQTTRSLLENWLASEAGPVVRSINEAFQKLEHWLAMARTTDEAFQKAEHWLAAAAEEEPAARSIVFRRAEELFLGWATWQSDAFDYARERLAALQSDEFFVSRKMALIETYRSLEISQELR